MQEKAEGERLFVEDVSSRANGADKIRWPLTLFVMFLPLVSLVLIIVGGLCTSAKSHTPKLFRYNWSLMYAVCLFLMIAFAVHLPLATVTGDSCEFMDEAETDIAGKLNITVQAAAILESCIAPVEENASISEAVGMTEFFSLLASYHFSSNVSTVYNVQAAFDWSADVDALADDAATVDESDFAGYDPNRVDVDLGQLNSKTLPDVFDRSNVATVDPSRYANSAGVQQVCHLLVLVLLLVFLFVPFFCHIVPLSAAQLPVQDKDNCLVGIRMEIRVAQALDFIHDLTANLANATADASEDTFNAIDVLYRRSPQDLTLEDRLSVMISSGNTVRANDRCTNIGDMSVSCVFVRTVVTLVCHSYTTSPLVWCAAGTSSLRHHGAT